MIPVCSQSFQKFDGLLVDKRLSARENDMIRLLVGVNLLNDRSTSTSRHAPVGSHDVWYESQNQHRRLHPDVRTNTEGTPASVPSPCSE